MSVTMAESRGALRHAGINGDSAGRGRLYPDRMPREVPRDDDLTQTLLGELPNARLSVHGEASLVGADATDPATMDWWGSATLTVWTDDERAATSGPWYSTRRSSRFAGPGGRWGSSPGGTTSG